VFGGYGLEQRMKNLDTTYLGRIPSKKLLGRLLVNVVYGHGREFSSGLIRSAGIGGRIPTPAVLAASILCLRSSSDASSAIWISTSPIP